MSTPEGDEAIGIVKGGQLALAGLFDRLDEEAMTRPATIGGGDWSAKDLLGHIAFWEELAVDTLTAWRGGHPPPTDADEWPGVDAANARNQERTTRESLAEVRERAAAAHADVVTQLQTVTAAEWASEPFYPGADNPTLGDLLGGVLGGSGGPLKHIEATLATLRRHGQAVNNYD